VIALVLAAALSAATPAPQHLPRITVHAPKAALKLQMATNGKERELGLMSVTHLAPHTGMVFVFPQDGDEQFWMKDTLVPLDMVWVSAQGIVTGIAINVPVVPLDTPDQQIPRRDGTGMYVIELPAGEAVPDGIRDGVRLRDITRLHASQ
jgi:uncharacterized membrane protein (UPF0127 family)